MNTTGLRSDPFACAICSASYSVMSTTTNLLHPRNDLCTRDRDPRHRVAPSAGFEPAHTAPEADALSPELRGRGLKTTWQKTSWRWSVRVSVVVARRRDAGDAGRVRCAQRC